MLELLRDLIGTAPAGYEWVEYVLLCVLLLLIVKITVDVFFAIFRVVFKW